MSTPVQPPSALAEALFQGFVFIADFEQGLSPREVRRFDELLADSTWTQHSAMRAALTEVRAHYGALWKTYSTEGGANDGRRIAQLLSRARAECDDAQWSALRDEVRGFGRRIYDSGTSLLTRLGLVAPHAAKQRAYAEFESLLEQVGRTPAALPGVALSSAIVSQPQMLDVDPGASPWPAARLDWTQPALWRKGRLSVQCVAVTPETHDVKTFTLVATPQRLFVYQPGQSITLDIPMPDRRMRRSYTLSSSPSRPFVLTITVKRVAGGTASNWLHDHLQPGSALQIGGPNGEFSCFGASGNKILLIAAGSGVTPIMSMLRWLCDTASPAEVVCINNVRTPEDVIFERELQHISTRFGERLRLGIVPSRVQPGQAWNGPVGHFSEAILRLYAPDFLEREVYVCGPAGYMEFVRSLLEQLGYPMDRFHQETFGKAPPEPSEAETQVVAPRLGIGSLESGPAIATATMAAGADAAPPAAVLEREITGFEVVFAKSNRSVRCTSQDCILEVAEENGIELNSSCRSGNCGTCKLKKLEGTVLMEGQTALSADEIEAGHVVICIGRPGSRVVLDA